MPIFVDRHDVTGVTAAQIADMHLRDLAVQEQYGVKFLTYWFDESRRTAFCLIDAPDEDAAQRVHAATHGHVAGEVIAVDLAVVEAFLGRITDPKQAVPATQQQVDSGHRAIMFTDIVGSTELTSRVGDLAATELVRAHDSLVRRALSKHGGRQVKHLGDGIMAAFHGSSAAVACGNEIKAEFRRFNETSAEALHVRIGIAFGEPVEDSSDLFGSTVQLASRLCQSAQPDEVLVSEAVRNECAACHGFVDRGWMTLKGFPKAVRAYATDDSCDPRDACMRSSTVSRAFEPPPAPLSSA